MKPTILRIFALGLLGLLGFSCDTEKPDATLADILAIENGLLDLDEDVNAYLKEWKIPESRFTERQKVTLRGLLTHTAGITVHGFPGYTHKDYFPSITEVLNGQGNTAKVYVDTIPGSIWRYSGGATP